MLESQLKLSFSIFGSRKKEWREVGEEWLFGSHITIHRQVKVNSHYLYVDK